MSSLSETAVQKQLDNMVSFIKKEAEEKANEIAVKAEEEFTLEKARLVQAQKLKIMKEFERREKQVEVQKKIAYSNELNRSRLRILKSREEGLQAIYKEATTRLSGLTVDDNKYKELLTALIVQGARKIDEDTISVDYREQDKALIEAVLENAQNQVNEEAGGDRSIKLVMGPGNLPGSEHKLKPCTGGVVLSAVDGRIALKNNLDTRLFLAYEMSLPNIRKLLYGTSKALLA